MTGWQEGVAWIVPVVLAITLHEAAHGWVAKRFGDDTAKRLGRVTLNPFKHIDRVGTLLLPGLLWLTHAPFLFGYAKPVPVNFLRLYPPRLGMCCVALAGVVMNLLLALISAALLHLDKLVAPEQAPLLFEMLYISISFNCLLIVFNLIPILPLDGGRVVNSLLPARLQRHFAHLERVGIGLVMAVLLVPPLLGSDLPQQLLRMPLHGLTHAVLWLTGNGE